MSIVNFITEEAGEFFEALTDRSATDAGLFPTDYIAIADIERHLEEKGWRSLASMRSELSDQLQKRSGMEHMSNLSKATKRMKQVLANGWLDERLYVSDVIVIAELLKQNPAIAITPENAAAEVVRLRADLKVIQGRLEAALAASTKNNASGAHHAEVARERTELIAENAGLKARNTELATHNAELQERVATQSEQIEQMMTKADELGARIAKLEGPAAEEAEDAATVVDAAVSISAGAATPATAKKRATSRHSLETTDDVVAAILKDPAMALFHERMRKMDAAKTVGRTDYIELVCAMRDANYSRDAMLLVRYNQPMTIPNLGNYVTLKGQARVNMLARVRRTETEGRYSSKTAVEGQEAGATSPSVDVLDDEDDSNAGPDDAMAVETSAPAPAKATNAEGRSPGRPSTPSSTPSSTPPSTRPSRQAGAVLKREQPRMTAAEGISPLSIPKAEQERRAAVEAARAGRVFGNRGQDRESNVDDTAFAAAHLSEAAAEMFADLTLKNPHDVVLAGTCKREDIVQGISNEICREKWSLPAGTPLRDIIMPILDNPAVDFPSGRDFASAKDRLQRELAQGDLAPTGMISATAAVYLAIAMTHHVAGSPQAAVAAPARAATPKASPRAGKRKLAA